MKSNLILALVLAAAITGLNAPKPPVIDDTAYLELARQIAKAPLDPYGFEQFWGQVPQPANTLLAPPVLPYWLGLGIRLLGDDPVRLKLWLFPIAVVFTLSLTAILRRFARGVESPILVMATLSPAVLPGLDFMLDIPALAFGFAAVAVFLRALDRRSYLLAAAAGLLAGVAAQTKYTGLVVPPLLFGASLLRRRVWFGVLAAVIAAAVFLLWESLVAAKYGESHLAHQLRASDTDWLGKINLAGSLVSLFGCVGLPAALIALPTWWNHRRGTKRRAAIVIAVFTVVIVAAHVFMAMFADLTESVWLNPERPKKIIVAPMLELLGWISVVAVLAALHRLLFRIRSDASNSPRGWLSVRVSWEVWFLALWVAGEVGGFFVLTPFPATRRVFGLAVVALIVAARLASRVFRGRHDVLWLAAMPSVLVGLFYAGLDLYDATVEPQAVREAMAFIREHDRSPKVWFTGHWGFQNEALRLGMEPVIPTRSLLQAGDWLVVPDVWLEQQRIEPAPQQGPPVHTVVVVRHFPIRTLPAYYGGRLSIEPWSRVRLQVQVFRIEAAWVPEHKRP